MGDKHTHTQAHKHTTDQLTCALGKGREGGRERSDRGCVCTSRSRGSIVGSRRAALAMVLNGSTRGRFEGEHRGKKTDKPEGDLRTEKRKPTQQLQATPPPGRHATDDGLKIAGPSLESPLLPAKVRVTGVLGKWRWPGYLGYVSTRARSSLLLLSRSDGSKQSGVREDVFEGGPARPRARPPPW